MTKKEKAEFVAKTLNSLYPLPAIPLDHVDPYTLLVAVVLSAQCTDKRVNEITPLLFAKARTPKQMVALEVEEIREIIKPCGLSPTKSKGIHGLSEIILRDHNGQVPNTFEELEALPSVGHKTASVVMSQAFGVPAFPVDTHIHRLAWRWGLSTGKSVERTETDLKRLFPMETWNVLHLQIIYFGREYCPAKGHDPLKCPICKEIGRKEMFR
ncbi:MAG: endonuclease III [Flavobacteriales bacterium]|jgi:endonuclease-3|nr:endonuclease III [Flavobacteriales bacterium]MCB0757467.1 endonuclease III [Flavobacteriales bacterium]